MPAIGKPENAGHRYIDIVGILSRCKRPYRLLAECPANAVNRIATNIEQTSTTGLALQANVLCFHRQLECEDGVDSFHAADGARIKQLPQLSRPRMMRPHEAIHQFYAFGPAIVSDRRGCPCVRRQRLFAKDVLAMVGG